MSQGIGFQADIRRDIATLEQKRPKTSPYFRFGLTFDQLTRLDRYLTDHRLGDEIREKTHLAAIGYSTYFDRVHWGIPHGCLKLVDANNQRYDLLDDYDFVAGDPLNRDDFFLIWSAYRSIFGDAYGGQINRLPGGDWMMIAFLPSRADPEPVSRAILFGLAVGISAGLFIFAAVKSRLGRPSTSAFNPETKRRRGVPPDVEISAHGGTVKPPANPARQLINLPSFYAVNLDDLQFWERYLDFLSVVKLPASSSARRTTGAGRRPRAEVPSSAPALTSTRGVSFNEERWILQGAGHYPDLSGKVFVHPNSPRPRRWIIAVPGGGGRFCNIDHPQRDEDLQRLVTPGVGVLVVQYRIDPTLPRDVGAHNLDQLINRFAEGREDLQAWIRFLRQLGAEMILLWGSSFGGLICHGAYTLPQNSDDPRSPGFNSSPDGIITGSSTGIAPDVLQQLAQVRGPLTEEAAREIIARLLRRPFNANDPVHQELLRLLRHQNPPSGGLGVVMIYGARDSSLVMPNGRNHVDPMADFYHHQGLPVAVHQLPEPHGFDYNRYPWLLALFQRMTQLLYQ